MESLVLAGESDLGRIFHRSQDLARGESILLPRITIMAECVFSCGTMRDTRKDHYHKAS